MSHPGLGPEGAGAAAAAGLPIGAVALPPLAVWGNLAVYAAAWGMLMWPQHLPLGRPAIAMVFAALACGLRGLCHVAWPDRGYPTVDILEKIDPTPISLLFGLMLVNAYLKDTGLWRRMEQLLDAPSPVALLIKICLCSALMSALLLNDTTCFVLTPIVISLCSKHKAQTTLPYLLGLSMSANIGSSLTIIGNPQNALIASICPGITFMGFMASMLTPVVVGLVLNTAALLLWFRRDLVFDAPKAEDTSSSTADVDVEASSSSASTPGGGGCSWVVYVAGVAAIVVGMVVSWALGLATDDVALAAGAALMLARAIHRKWAGASGAGTETDFALGAVDYPLLVLFIGQFILVGATVDTGLPQRMLQGILGSCADGLGASPACVFWFTGLVLLLSNVIGNVPVILMLRPLFVRQQAEGVEDLWTLCAWVATVAGNLTMLGSAANLIVAHAAKSLGEHGYTATTLGKFSVPPTLVVTVVGVLLMPPVGPSWAWVIGGAGISAALLALPLACIWHFPPAQAWLGRQQQQPSLCNAGLGRDKHGGAQRAPAGFGLGVGQQSGSACSSPDPAPCMRTAVLPAGGGATAALFPPREPADRRPSSIRSCSRSLWGLPQGCLCPLPFGARV